MKSGRSKLFLNLDDPGSGDVALFAALDLMPVQLSMMVKLFIAKSADVPFLRLFRWRWDGLFRAWRNNNSENIFLVKKTLEYVFSGWISGPKGIKRRGRVGSKGARGGLKGPRSVKWELQFVTYKRPSWVKSGPSGIIIAYY